ncbi:kelch-like protein 12 isoform X2 [Acanthaster planci]|uniref:Kelch-like protein 12 isoform X2 n=1 Tax=Acanthaster planci TaxID=133434 RepID=A0A8B7YRS5_ACAPL|nr:kelch-like protein 12 isoform X2 [Acanthaster planci]
MTKMETDQLCSDDGASLEDQRLHSFTGSHCKTMMQTLNRLRKQSLLCDVTVVVEGVEFPAHRVILAACSNYFCAMFTNEMSESTKSSVELKGLKASAMEKLLEFIYTEEVEVTVENVQELLPSACLLQLKGVEDACCAFLTTQLDASNCIGIAKFAESHACMGLLNAAEGYGCRYFSEIVKHEEYLSLEVDEVAKLIKRDDLEVECEEPVYEAVMIWVNHNASERQDLLPTLLQDVRIPLMTPKFITDVLDKEPLIRQSLACRDLVDEGKRFHLRPDCRAEMTGSNFQSRSGGDERLVVIGGFGSQQVPLNIVEEYSPKTKEWHSLPDLSRRRRYLAAVMHSAHIYAVGGYDGSTRLNIVECLKFTQGQPTWVSMAPLNVKRGLPGAAVLNDAIYAAGGFDGNTRLTSAECYDPRIDRWTMIQDMNTGREGAGLTTANSVLYSIGGYDGNSILDSVEMFDSRSGQWSAVASMKVKRSGAGVATINDMIYAVGGFNGSHHLASVECYNPRTNSWSLVASMTTARCYVGAVAIQGKVCAVGGYDGRSLLNTIETYDPVNDSWALEGTMAQKRCDAGVSVLRMSDPRVSAV